MNEAAFDVRGVAALEPLIELVDVHKTFVTTGGVEVEALRGISLKIFPGEFVAIMGPSGCGKSTLMNLLGCLDRPTSGSYHFAGKAVSEFGGDELAFLRREAFGFVFQSYNLISTITAVENVEVPAIYTGLSRTERRQRATELLTRLGLADRLDHRPNQLSGGQQQRVSIARSLMNGGKILLADEPTGALDSKSGTEVMGLLRSLADEGHTVILISHDREVADHADRRIEMRDGKITGDSGFIASCASAVAIERESAIPTPNRASPVAWSDLTEATSMALRSLRVNLFRTALTLLGIMIGVGSVVAMLAIGEGAKQSVLNRISAMGTNLLMVRPGAQNSRGFGGFQTLYPEDAAAIGEVDGVAASVPENVGNVTARYGSTDYQTSVDATTAEFPGARDWPIGRGTFFTSDDQRAYATVAVLGQTVVDNLFADGTDPIGNYVLIKNVPFIVVGVMSKRGANVGGGDTDDTILVPLTTGSLRLFGTRNLRSITVSVVDVKKMSDAEELIRVMLISRHGKEDFRINNMAEIMATATETQNTMTILLGSIAAISLLVGGIGVMNIMLVSVTERTREIGIRMATGARMRNILDQFLTEAIVVSGIGGVIGVLGGVAVALVLSVFGTQIKITPGPMILAFSCAAATGLVFGFAPALKAARLDPVVALASE